MSKTKHHFNPVERKAEDWINNTYNSIKEEVDAELLLIIEPTVENAINEFTRMHFSDYKEWLKNHDAAAYDFSMSFEDFMSQELSDDVISDADTLGDEFSKFTIFVANEVIDEVFDRKWNEFVTENGIDEVAVQYIHDDVYEEVAYLLHEESAAVLYRYTDLTLDKVGMSAMPASEVFENAFAASASA